MSNVGYDLDTSGGLMPLIKALIKPPDEELNVQKPKKPQHPYYKRPGKGHNHDSCDACGEGGDLICCDRCPASFHLGCYDPPLDENDIPAGLWLCKECLASDDNKPASSRSSRAQSPADSKSDTEKKTRSLRNRSNSAKKKVKEDDEKEPEPEKELSPMEVLVKAARIMNPTQFELPREMRIPCVFPGTEKDMGKNGNGSLVTVDAWGCVPIPAKLCFVCQGTCKQAPLLMCDYCPLLFHLDCLDPPLTALPTGRWMCPNHVEQYIDWKLVNSISASERVALWDRFAGPLDAHAVAMDFLRRANSRHPSFRVKVTSSSRGRVVVPDMVRQHYRHPAPLLPSRREFVRCNNLLKSLKASGTYDFTEEDQDLPKHKICMNVSCPQYTGQGLCPHSQGSGHSPALKGVSEEDAVDDLQAISDPKMEPHSDSSSDLSDSDCDYYTATVKKRKVSQSEDKSPNKRGRNERLELRPEGNVEELLAAVDEQLKKLDERLVKLLAWQRLQQVVAGEHVSGAWRTWGWGEWGALGARAAAAVRRSLQTAQAQRLRPGAPAGRALPSELLSRRDRERIVAAVWGAPPPAPPRAPSPRRAAADLAAAAVKALLTPITAHNGNGIEERIGRAIPIRLSCISIGTDSGCGVRLDSSCRRASRNHATIFMDEVSRHFELINYSEWGSCVNGVLYTCDIELAAPQVAPPGASPSETDSRAAALRDIVRHRQQDAIRINGNLTRPTSNELSCRCPLGDFAPQERAGAWEGSALVPHGALLRFGCQEFVFSIIDAIANDEETEI